ncbi:type IV secretion protein Rhs [Kribbella sandramycini]|uniref:RHS repeat-associated protein n=1 Tax=Kribbella sandramycini TaxID=60450 RepID=A0A7Y4KWM2_9ACTN|nr:RHS repeat-associated core domain-containing protein [Kribbella sandramycini]MBB6567436.1 RHS repeat-associated protein [Kribbella sandramycini]NOL39954.1 type IV secretion protein Rhs [Kribbella sandramycini]
MRYRKAAAGLVTVALFLSMLTTTAYADFDRKPQPYDSTPVEPVAGADSAFRDGAADWSGTPGDAAGDADDGDWSATDLAAAGAWTQGGASGAFSYTYDLRLPPATGPTPSLGLTYSSAEHDGRTSGSNSQASAVGDGWSLAPNFIERTYTSCADDKSGDPAGNLCWDGDSPSITISLDGVSTALVRDDATKAWKAADDVDWKIQHSESPEQWTITTTDGTKHHFGATATSRWTVPVFGNHSGEACYPSRCDQTYRWMLDKSVDVHGNSTQYTYETATGRYAVDSDTQATYVREGWLKSIEYGVRTNAKTAKVEFTMADRCLSDCREPDGEPRKAKWPDTPWELTCKAGTRCERTAPAFFSSKRLAAVTSYVVANGNYTPVDSWKLTHKFKDYGDKEQVVLWLAAIQHTGHVGGTATTPPVEFGGTFLPNRVDTGEAFPGIWRPRLTSIKNETGGVTTVNYTEPDCGRGDLPASAHQNNRRCFPARYTPEGLSEPVDVYFHKYVVRSVAESDATGGGDTVWKFYEYSTEGGGTAALWAWNDAEFVEKKDRDWNQWRGYAQVVTLTGDPADPGPQLRTRARYYRGLDGDKLPSGKRSVTLTDANGQTATDHRALAGVEWETASFNDTTLIGTETSWYWTARTAKRSYEGGSVEAWLTGERRTDTRTLLAPSVWRTARTETAYDERGREIRVDQQGDVAKSGDERCVRTTYADNTALWLLELVSTVESVSVGCAATVNRPTDVIGGLRAYYNGTGLMTRSEALESGDVYKTIGTSTFDTLGRQLTATDALGNKTTTAYVPAAGGPVTATTSTNALGHVTTTKLLPGWGLITETTDPNARRTVASYDPLGRRTAVWLPGRDATTESASQRFSYHVAQNTPTTVTAERMIHDGSYLRSVTLYDSLLRSRQVQAQTNGGRLVSQTVYDSYGRERFNSGPVYNNVSGPNGTLVRISRTNDVARTELAYDAAGRVTDEVFVVKDREKWRTSYRFGGDATNWRTTVIAPEGGTSRSTLVDALGRTVELRQYKDRNATGAFDATKYTYAPNGQLGTVTDPGRNQWRYEYDVRGRRTALHDPDTGTSRTAYNAGGQVTATTNGNNETINYQYDALGRQTRVLAGTTPLVERAYDGAEHGIGMPFTATRWVDGQAWTSETRKYTPEGQAKQVYTHLPKAAGALAGSYWEAYTYNEDGSLHTSGAKAAGSLDEEVMTQSYDAMGRPSRVTSWGDDFGFGHVYVDNAVYSPYGQLLQRRLGDSAWQTWIYEEGTGRLEQFYFDKNGTNHDVAALSYRYDASGNVLAIGDTPETQCFRYDSLQRLTDAWAQTSATCAEPTAGGPAAYHSAYTYDLVGNRKSERRWTPGGSVEDTYSYAAGPHQLTGVASTSGASTAFSYDKAGFSTGIDADVLDWTPTGRLNTVTSAAGTAKFYDNADGQRLLRADANGDLTAWVAGYELTYTKATGKVEATRYYKHGDDVVGTRNGLGDLLWVAGDHHGTNQWIVNSETLTATVRRRDPFGNQRGPAPATWPDNRGFVGGLQNDAVQLTTIGAREYDAATGRFISADPLMDLADPQQLNGYAYANNSPVTMSDPSGLKSVRKAARVPKPGKKVKKQSKSTGQTRTPRKPNTNGAARRGPGSSEATPPRAPKGIPDRPNDKKVRPGGPITHPGGTGVAAPRDDMSDRFWNGVDQVWDVASSTCGLQPTERLRLGCEIYTEEYAPGGIGVCTGVNASSLGQVGVSNCAVYTRDDGLVMTSTTQKGFTSTLLGVGANLGGTLTSASSAEELTGSGWTVGVEGGASDFVSVGTSSSVPTGGNWSTGANVGVGAGVSPPIGGSLTYEETTAVTYDQYMEAWREVMPFF